MQAVISQGQTKNTKVKNSLKTKKKKKKKKRENASAAMDDRGNGCKFLFNPPRLNY